MLAIDWAHTKKLIACGGDGTTAMTPDELLELPETDIVVEDSCPFKLLLRLLKAGKAVSTIPGQEVAGLRKERGLDKSDEVDAQLIYELAPKAQPLSLDSHEVKLKEIYYRFISYQKTRIVLENQLRAFRQTFGGQADLGFTIATEAIAAQEHSYLERLKKFIPRPPQPLAKIKGLGDRLWAGLLVVAHPKRFPTLGAYLRFCGLKQGNRYNRHARMLYYLLAKEVVMQKDKEFYPLYQKMKADLGERNPEWKKGHLDKAARNRVATMIAKRVYNCQDDIPIVKGLWG